MRPCEKLWPWEAIPNRWAAWTISAGPPSNTIRKSTDGKYKAAQLVRANLGIAGGLPRLSDPPAVGQRQYVHRWKSGRTVRGKKKDFRTSDAPLYRQHRDRRRRKCVTMDVKFPGDLLYVLGLTK